jgi:membrane protein
MGILRRGWALLVETINLWMSRNAFEHAGALAFYTLFSLAPLIIILVAITAVVYGDDAAQGQISSQINEFVGARAAEAVEEAVYRSRLERTGLLPTILGVAALLFGATTVFAQMQTALNDFWGVTARPTRSSIAVFLKTRLVSLGLVLVIGFLLLTSLVVTTALAALMRYAGQWMPVPEAVVMGVNLGVSLAVITALFAMIFKILPDVHLAWRDMWRGAFITAILFVAGQSGISLYLSRTAPDSTYGAAGSLVLLLFWVYYSSLILFFGAALTRATINLRGDHIVPKRSAVRVKQQILEEQDDGRMRKVEEKS